MDSSIMNLDYLYHDPGIHSNLVMTTINEFRAIGEYCDVTIIAGPNRISAHRLILAACCPYFRVMFRSKLCGTQDEEISINSLDPSCVKALIMFFYTSTITINEDNVENLLQAATFFQLDQMKKKCSDFLQRLISTSNCLGIEDLASALSCVDLQMAANKYICKNFHDVTKCEEFLMLSAKRFIHILTSGGIYVESEKNIYFAVLTWMKYNFEVGKHFLPELFKCIRLPLLGLEFISNVVEVEGIINQDQQCCSMIQEAKDYLQLVAVSPEISQLDHKILFTVGPQPTRCAVASTVVGFLPIQWKILPINNVRLHHPTQAVALNGLAYVFGNNPTVMCTYNPRTNTWVELKSHSLSHDNTQVAALDGHLYAVGSNDDDFQRLKVERFNSQLNCWTRVGDSFPFRTEFRVVGTNGLLYVIGGKYPKYYVGGSLFQSFDPVLGKWTRNRSYDERDIMSDSSVTYKQNIISTNPGVAVFKGDIYLVKDALNDRSAIKYDCDRGIWIHPGSMRNLNTGKSKPRLVVFDSDLYVFGEEKDEENFVERLDQLYWIYWSISNYSCLPFKDSVSQVIVIEQPDCFDSLDILVNDAQRKTRYVITPRKPGLLLLKPLMVLVRTIFSSANKVSLQQKAFLLDFLAGSPHTEFQYRDRDLVIKLSEHQETVLEADNSSSTVTADLYMTCLESGEWRFNRLLRRVDGTIHSREVLPDHPC